MKVELDEQKIRAKINYGVHKAQVILDARIAADSNYYAPFDVGTLQGSVFTGSNFGSGVLIWDEQYAKAQYYGLPNKSKVTNPNAQMKWFEAAKAKKSKEWEKLANEEYNQ